MKHGREPRPEKVAVVDEIRRRFSSSDAALLTDFRGIDVAGMTELRDAVRKAGGELKIYKNTLVRIAARDLSLDLDDMLVGPTALCFVERVDDKPGDPARVAKVLTEFAQNFEGLVIKGGVLGETVVDASAARALADLPPRESLLAEFAGAMESLLAQFAGLLDAKLREFAWAMQELLDKGGPPGGSSSADAAQGAAEADSQGATTEATTEEISGDRSESEAEGSQNAENE